MKHTTIKYDPLFGAKPVTIDVPETSRNLEEVSTAHENIANQQHANNDNHKEAIKTVVRTRAIIVKKQRVNNGRHK